MTCAASTRDFYGAVYGALMWDHSTGAPETAKSYLRPVMRKLDSHTRVEGCEPDEGGSFN